MARTPVRHCGWGMPAAVSGVPVAASGRCDDMAFTDRACRMARFVAGARGMFARALAVSGLLLGGWLLSVVFALFGAAPAAADGSAVLGVTGSASLEAPAGSVASSTGEFPAADGFASAPPIVALVPKNSAPVARDVASIPARGASAPESVVPISEGLASVPENAEAMAGLGVDGLTSQSKPVLPMPATADQSYGAQGYVPSGSGGAGLIGSATGDVARSAYDPRLMVQRVPHAVVLPPVVRTAADEPSFSPD